MYFIGCAITRQTSDGFDLMHVGHHGELENSGRILLTYYQDATLVSELVSTGHIECLCNEVSSSHERVPRPFEPEIPGWDGDHHWLYRFRTLRGLLRDLQNHSSCRHLYLFDIVERRWSVGSRAKAPVEPFSELRPLAEVMAELT